MKKQVRKMTLSRETLHRLELGDDTLAGIAAAVTGPTCLPDCTSSCIHICCIRGT
jgi:hypothetical protein